MDRTAGQLDDALTGVLDALPDAIAITDLLGNVVRWNRSAEGTFGYRADESLGEPIARLYQPDARETVMRHIARDLDERGEFVGEVACVRKDGVAVTVEMRTRLVAGVDGASGLVVTASREVSDHRRTDGLRGSLATEQRSAFMAEASAALVSSLDYETTLQRAAHLAVPAFADFCTIDVLDETGQVRRLALANVDRTREPELREMARGYPPGWEQRHPVGQVLRTGKPVVAYDLPGDVEAAIRRSESNMALSRAIAPRSYMILPLVARDVMLGAMGFVMTLSGRRFSAADLPMGEELARRVASAIENARLYHAEQRARQEAEAAVRTRDEFLSIASHELRTPVTAVKAAAQLLLRAQSHGTLDAERLERLLRSLEAASDRLTVLTEDLLDVSRLKTDHLRLRLQAVDLAAFAREVAERYRDQLTERHWLTVDAVEACPLQVDVDRLEQVLANLITNAVKYSPDGGAITIAVRRQGQAALLSVCDAGIGLPAGAEETIFLPFGRASNAAERQIQGMGLGLYIARGIVERHGGRIWAESEGEGRGTRVCVQLPSMAGAESRD